jgi:hypothetical protein
MQSLSLSLHLHLLRLIHIQFPCNRALEFPGQSTVNKPD